MRQTVPRRHLLRVGGALALGIPTIATAQRPSATPMAGTPHGDGRSVRLASVRTVQDGGLLPRLVAEFAAQTGYEVAVHTGEDVYERARAGEADLVFSHLGHRDAQAFIEEGLGVAARGALQPDGAPRPRLRPSGRPWRVGPG